MAAMCPSVKQGVSRDCPTPGEQRLVRAGTADVGGLSAAPCILADEKKDHRRHPVGHCSCPLGHSGCLCLAAHT